MSGITEFFTNDPLFAIFALCAVLGAAVFLLSFVLDGIFDGLFDLGSSDTMGIPIVQLLAVFLGTGGAAGLISMSLTEIWLVSTVTSIVIGGALAALFMLLVDKLHGAGTKDYPLVTDHLIGSEVAVSWWNAKRGEIIVTINGHVYKVDASSEEELVKPSSVLLKSLEVENDRPSTAVVTGIV